MKKLAITLAAALMIASTGCGDSKSPILTYVARSSSDNWAPHLYTLNEATQQSTPVSIAIPTGAFDVSPNSDASKVVYDRDGDSGWDIFLMGTDGVEKELTTGADAWAPVFSPDGKTIAYVSDTSGDDQIYTIGVDGSNPTTVFAAAGEEEEMPVFSADGKSLVFWAWLNNASANSRRAMRHAHPAGPLHGQAKQTSHHATAHVTGFADDGLYQIGVSGSTPTLIYATNEWWGQPVFTGDGTGVLFTLYDGTEYNVFSVKLDGSALTPLTTSTDTYNFSPVPYKNLILFNRYNSDTSSGDIYVMNPDGSSQTLVHSTASTYEAVIDSYDAWD